MDSNILLASFAGGMVGGFTGAYIATRNLNKQIEEKFKDDVVEKSTSTEESKSEAEKSKESEDNKSSEEKKETSSENIKKSSNDIKSEAENKSTESKPEAGKSKESEDNKSSKDQEAEHVDGETVGVDPTASIDDTEVKSVSFTIVNDDKSK